MYFKAYINHYTEDLMIYDSRIDDLAIYDAVVTQEVDASGSFTFTMPPTHPFYNRINYINKDDIQVIEYAEDNTEIDRIFGGILSEIHTDFIGNKTFVWYGWSIVLRSSYMPTYDLSGLDLSHLEDYISVAIAGSYGITPYAFSFGNYGSLGIPQPYETGQETAYSVLQNILAMYPNVPVHYYTKWDNYYYQFITSCFIGNFTEMSTQQIKVGSNLLDFHENILDGDFYTGIVGFGAETEIEKYGRKVRYWVPESGSSEDSKIFWNNTLKDLYGQKVGVFYWDDITSVSALESRCQAVASSMKLKKELSCSVFDLSKITNADRLEIGEGVVVMTMRNGSYVGELFYITKIERNLTDPTQDNLTMKNYN